MEVKKLVVGKGITSRLGSEELWTREHYEITVLIEDVSELEVTKANLVGLIDGWLSATKPASTPAKMPQLAPNELAQLPWTTYRTKQPCKPDEAGWIFVNTPGAEALADLIQRQGKGTVVQIGGHKFELKSSGSGRQFIGRAPSKK